MKALTALFAATLLTTAIAQSAQAEESALRPLGSLIEKHQQQDRTLAENGADRSLQPSIQRQQQRLDPRRALAADGAERTLQQWPQRQPTRGAVA
ncbi:MULTISPECIES: hypothetical protein [Pseudomonas]|uniref:Phage infection protein n=1 Tax=Pseudomonas oryzihabitans TaxID=47885 RepID=A0A178L3J7_9PSED|nr:MULTISPECIES: hypothetical protein [Pseudomonas]KXJ30662.1 hypothetical protein AX284_06615 [Pseudomonas sp. HUK17]MXS21181.1 hypothetical protein [Pseudomonas oryzihabitans]NRH44385.1 hypothetical protein [Pseudomonas sp. MS15a(2019)]OAN24107.1 hypothetical protein A4V15_08690 [Pseudomonas oryzihabitans]